MSVHQPNLFLNLPCSCLCHGVFLNLNTSVLNVLDTFYNNIFGIEAEEHFVPLSMVSHLVRSTAALCSQRPRTPITD